MAPGPAAAPRPRPTSAGAPSRASAPAPAPPSSTAALPADGWAWWRPLGRRGALLPVLVGVAAGERPAALVWLGIAAAVPGIWLVSREETRGSATAGGSGLLDGVLAGLGFGLLFAALGQVPEGAGLWPLRVCEVAAVVTTVVAAVTLRGDPRPRGGAERWGLASGLLAAAAGLAFLLATHRGLLSVSAVVLSLYPAFTVLLAALVLHEHIHRAQAGASRCAGPRWSWSLPADRSGPWCC